MRTIHLYGALAEEFGERIRLSVNSTGEALRAIEANYPGKLIPILQHGSYYVVAGKDMDGAYLTEEMVDISLGENDLHIMPEAVGAGGGKKKGFIQVIIGVALIAAAFYFAPAAAAGEGFLGAALSAEAAFGITYGNIAMFGAGLVLQGVSSFLAPTPQVPDTNLQQRESPDQRPSFIFNGPVNTLEQGGPVPLVFGQMLIGSRVISGGITTEDVEDE